MHKALSTTIIIFLLLSAAAFGQDAKQNITKSLPADIGPEAKYVLYLHGGIVGAKGPENAVSEYYGKYEYFKILEALAEKGFHVIAEVRPQDTKEKEYASKLKKQIKKLLKAGVPEKNITVVGASLGAYIAVETAKKIKRMNLKYALLGLCSDYALGLYAKYKGKLKGDFLSIYEASDEKKSCKDIFTPLHKKAKFQEIKLEMGNSHSFLYEPYDEWVLPLVEWTKD